ncbi:hypothetical protein D349_02126 [Enterococcus faecalis UP2S-6]|nr:hypothetical protein D349_02126 [Enterococcus faecalis UP2S-6]
MIENKKIQSNWIERNVTVQTINKNERNGKKQWSFLSFFLKLSDCCASETGSAPIIIILK